MKPKSLRLECGYSHCVGQGQGAQGPAHQHEPCDSLQLRRSSPADAPDFTGQLVEMGITRQQSGAAVILKVGSSNGIGLHTQVHRFANYVAN